MSKLKTQNHNSKFKTSINKFLALNFGFKLCVLRFGFGLILPIFLIIIFTSSVQAADVNNIYGIHLAQPHLDALDESARLVNSTGGDWGYVTLVMQENDRKFDKWQEIFNRLRKLHLIPIIRLATQPEGEVWRRPLASEAKDWVDFLDSLNWVIKKRYVVLFNEPNHGSEWGGEVDAKNYAAVATEFAKVFKNKNPDFYIMLAGFDASAPQSPPNYVDEAIFINTMIGAEPTLFDNIDGWSSHSYPNPGFSGNPNDSGRGTVKTYEWELNLLKSLGIGKDLPVFITETGWKRGSEDAVASDFQNVFQTVWSTDNRILAVTPFVLDYQSAPFLEFSWKKQNSSDFYKQYYAVQSLKKIKGQPEQIDKGEIEINLPKKLVAQSNYHLKIKLKNLGQAVWDKDDDYELRITNYEKNNEYFLIADIKNIVPFEEKEIDLFLKTTSTAGKKTVKFALEKTGQKILESRAWQFEVLPLPSLKFNVNLFPKLNDKGGDFEIQFFDEDENLVFKKTQLEVFGGEGTLNDIQNVIVGAKYRVVVLKKYYLPRQNFLVLKKGKNSLKFKIMLPFDFDADGKLSINDFGAIIKNPKLLKLLVP